MIDVKNLNRIKGILSAKQGAEIPKFQQGAKFAMYNGRQVIYSMDQLDWFTDEALTTAYGGSLGGFKSIQYTPTTKKNSIQPSQHPQTEIPGDPKITPTTAVETAADIQEKVRLTQQEYDIGKRYETLQVSQEANTQALSALNKPLTLDTNLLQQDINKGIAEASASVVKFKQQQQQQIQDNRDKITNAIGQGSAALINDVGQAFAAKQQATDSNLTKGIDTAYSGVAESAKSFGPIGQAVGSVMNIAKGTGDIIQELGGGTDQQSTMDKWMDSAFFSWNVGMVNGFFGKNTQDFGVDQDAISKVGSSYGGTVDVISDAAEKAGKKYGLFSNRARKKANRTIDKARTQQNIMATIADNATDQRLAAQSMGEQAGLAYSLMTDGGYNQKYTYAAKHGGLLEWSPVIALAWEPQVELNWELPIFKEGGNIDLVEELEWIPEFKSGGKTEESDVPQIEETTQKNVIPEGALHKNKHHMEHAEGLTKKGIPVIDDDGEQQAEIEHSEIIFTLEVTKKLEEYYKIFYSDEATNKEKEQAALDAGKLLVYQILENTEDRTGLIESCKKGGSLTFKQSTDDLIEEALEWMPTVVIIEEDVKEKPKKREEKSDNELMKEAIKEVLVDLLTK